MNDEQQRALVLQLRAQLDRVIVDEGERRAAEAEIDEALAMPRTEGGRRLADVLRSRHETRAWMREREPDTDAERFTGPAGDPAGVGTYFVCPNGDFDFIRDHVSDVVPPCPRHHVPLERAD